MLKAHCILYYRSGQRSEYYADSQREIEAIMAQAGRQARKRGDEVTHWASGVCQVPETRSVRESVGTQTRISALQLPNAPFDE